MSVERSASRDGWSPEGQAEWDQLHAQALDKLRGTHTFILAYLTLGENAEGDTTVETSVIGGNCETDLHSRILLSVLDTALDHMRDEYIGEDV